MRLKFIITTLGNLVKCGCQKGATWMGEDLDAGYAVIFIKTVTQGDSISSRFPEIQGTNRSVQRGSTGFIAVECVDVAKGIVSP